MKRCVWMALFLVVGLGAECPMDGTTGPDGSPTPLGVEIAAERRIAIVDELGEFMKALDRSVPYGRQNQAIVEMLLTIPEIASAGTDPTGAVWATFTDGRLIGVYNDPEPESASPVDEQDLENNDLNIPIRFAERGKLDDQARNIPGGKAQIITGIQESRRSATPYLQRLFSRGGWEISPDGPRPSIENWMSLDLAGFYFFEGHGTLFENADGVMEFAFVTNIPVNLDSELLLSQDLLDRAVFPVVGSDGDYSTYAITKAFVEKHIEFSDECVVWFNSCCSASVPAQGFMDACLAKGAALYVGWSASVWDVDAEAAVYYAVNHSLGTNATAKFKLGSGQGDLLPPVATPPRRPFSMQSAFGDAAPRKSGAAIFGDTAGLPYNQSRGVNCEDPENCTLIDSFLKLVGNPSLPSERRGVALAPSIQRLEVDEKEKTLTIYGEFDNDGFNRKVVVGGQTFLDADWGLNKIVISNFPEDAFGEVRVVHKKFLGGDLQQSNPRWLTKISDVKFRIKRLECTRPQPGDFYCGEPVQRTCNRFSEQVFSGMTFRADVGFGRDVPFGEPVYQGGKTYPGYPIETGATHTYSVGGSDKKGANALEIWDENSGSTSFVFPETVFSGIDSGVSENQFTCYFIATADVNGNRRARFEPSAWVPDGLTIRIGSDCNGQDEYISGILDLGGNNVVFGDPTNTVSGDWDLDLNDGGGWDAIDESYDDGDDMYEYSAPKPTISAWPDDNAPQ